MRFQLKNAFQPELVQAAKYAVFQRAATNRTSKAGVFRAVMPLRSQDLGILSMTSSLFQ